MTAYRIAGLDLSLAGTAAVVLDSDGRPAGSFAYTSTARDLTLSIPGHELRRAVHVKRGDRVADYQRTVDVADGLRVWLRSRLQPGALVGIEDHAFGAQGRALYQLGHLHGVVRRDVVGLGCSFVLLGVSEVKQSATGSGAADKAAMLAAAHGSGLPTVGLSRGVREGLADAYAVARLAWAIDRARRGLQVEPGPTARLLAGGLRDRPWIG